MTATRRLPWREPLDVLAPFADEPDAFALLSDGVGEDGRWSYVGRRPVAKFGDLVELRALVADPPVEPTGDGPPFRGGAVGLATYEFGATIEPRAPQSRRTPRWPDFAGGVYDQLLAFDHHTRAAWAVARGRCGEAAEACLSRLVAETANAPSRSPIKPGGSAAAASWDRDYAQAVADVIAAIAAGEIFQANIARGWGGRLASRATPFDLLAALHACSPAPFGGYLRRADAALVSRSPERFISVTPQGVARTSPIKGTRPRGRDAREDALLAADLLASAKDRAENLMILDVMRNDLARVCVPGSVEVDAFCALRSFSNVHHLVSTVSGRLAVGQDALDLFASAFPPASISGAPKLQAMTVIARHEPPRGAYCGSLFRLGYDGGFDSNVLIRTVALDGAVDGWGWEARAGAGITADSDPRLEDAEAAHKARSVLTALVP